MIPYSKTVGTKSPNLRPLGNEREKCHKKPGKSIGILTIGIILRTTRFVLGTYPDHLQPYMESTGLLTLTYTNTTLIVFRNNILASLNILLHIYPHTTLLTILDVVRVLPISLMYQNFNRKFTSPPRSLVSVLPLMLPLFGIHFLKTFVHHPLLPLLERSYQNLSLRKGLSSLAHFLLWLLHGADLLLSLDFEFAYCYCLVAP